MLLPIIVYIVPGRFIHFVVRPAGRLKSRRFSRAVSPTCLGLVHFHFHFLLFRSLIPSQSIARPLSHSVLPLKSFSLPPFHYLFG